MKWETIALTALAGYASAVPQGVTQNIAPQGAAPAGCSPNYPGTFQISVSKTGSKSKRQNGGALLITLNNGVLKDAQSRTGYIASNYQFQFDGPAQAGAIYTAGFSVCQNNLLALGSSTTFYQCGSGNFYNLYDRNWAPQCEPVTISIIPSGGSSSSSSQSGPAFGTRAVGQIPDGQIQAPTGTNKPAPPPHSSSVSSAKLVPPPVTQIPDGQIQAPTGTNSTNKPAPPPHSSSASSVKPAPPPVTQIPDGQIQAPTGTNKPVPPPHSSSASSAKPAPPPAVSQIPDGQVQAAPNPARHVSQIYDGQIQAPVSSGRVVSQIPDGQIQVPPTNQPPPPPPTTKPPPPPPTVAPPPPPGKNTTVTTGKPSPPPPPPGPTYTYTSHKPIPTPPTPGPSPPPVLPPNSGIQVGPNAAMALIFGAIGALFFL